MQPWTGHLKFIVVNVTKEREYHEDCLKSVVEPVGSVLQVNPSVLLQPCAIHKALTTLRTRMGLDAKVGLEVSEMKI